MILQDVIHTPHTAGGVDSVTVLDKNTIFSAFCSKCLFFMKLTHIQVLKKKECMKLE